MKVKLLRNEESFNYNENDASKIISLLFIEETTIKFLSYPIYGFINDKIGRKKVAIGGYISLCVILYAISLVRELKSLYILWGVYTIGIVAIASVPLTGDYVDDEYKGKGTGI